MATYCPEDASSRELSCPICFEDYDIHDNARAPKLLLCLHTFCLECTRKLWQEDGTLECSLCRMVHEQVSLDDLFDNHVIVQHLRQECERRDLDLARRIDEELRRGDCVTSVPDIGSEIKPVSSWDEEGDKTIESNDDSTNQPAHSAEVQVPAGDVYARNNIRNFLDYLMENTMAVGPEVNGDYYNQEGNEEEEQEEEDEDEEQEEEEEEDNDDAVDMPVELELNEEEEEEEEDDIASATNPAFSLSNIQALFGQIDEDPVSESDDTSDGVGASPMLTFGNFLAMIGQRAESDNNQEDEEEEEEEEEERWHSASDEFHTHVWGEDDSGQMPSRSEVEEQDSDPFISDWQFVTPESFLEE